MDGKEKIEDCYRRMYRGMIDKDRGLLSEVLGRSFVLVHMTGMRQPKEEFIRAVENGTLNYFSADHQHMETEIQGDRAKLTGQSVVSAAVFGGGRSTWRLQLKLALIKDADTWRIVEAKASTY
ncbi:MAG: nuclear transport factor 2 family protein [Acetatifactor muris]|nr:nuclear transport factor 2 family protein [Blautia sp.]MCM1194208.1 nuclear transport factor 2 family protein [Acetatifactor muris]